MALRCPKCRSEVPAENVNIAANVAKCESCGEVFRPGEALAAVSGAAPASGPQPPAPSGPPEGTRIEVDDRAGGVSVRLPPRGFGADTVFLGAFTIAWWSFLLMFVGVGAWGIGHGGNGSAPAQERKAEPPAAPARPGQAPADKPAGGKDDASMPEKVIPAFMLLFMLPFFVAGFAMLGAVLWPLFGRVLVSVDGVECTHRASLFGLGRTHRAAVGETRIVWRPAAGAASPPMPAFMRRMHGAAGGGGVFLSLGTWETGLGGYLSEREQEWVFHVLRRALGQGGRVG